MSKNIIVCSDGTGNTAIKGRGTNVFKLFEAIDLNGHRTNPPLVPQVAIYDDGVGTEDFKPLKVFAGITGWGLSRNVKDLYKELVRVYDPGDRIFLFGFSRGAFTVRTLAGFIGTCGILDVKPLETNAALEDAVDRAYREYRQRYRTTLMKLVRGEPRPQTIAAFRQRHCLPGDVPIAFIGVWDTVDAVGMPFHIADVINAAIYRFKFPDRTLNGCVERACQALSIDDQRDAFRPLLWQYVGDDDRRIEQVWFSGAHSNVGGGYPKQGMSLVTLAWMLRKAEESGLRLIPFDRAFYPEHANVDDKLYDPRAGLGVFYRWKIRDVAALCRAHAVPPAIHLSALERVAHGTDDYAPGNLAPDARVVITPTGDPTADAAAAARARAVESVLRRAHAAGRPLLSRVWGAMTTGLVAYYVYLAACLATLIAASSPEAGAGRWKPWLYVKNAVVLVWNVVTVNGDALLGSAQQLLSLRWLLVLLVGGFVVSYALMTGANRRMSRVFSEFWHRWQPVLREELKDARRLTGGR